jgi:hypothetical protein
MQATDLPFVNFHRMFLLKYLASNIALAVQLMLRGEWRRVFAAIYARLYQKAYFCWFVLVRPFRAAGRTPLPSEAPIVETDHPVAFTSPDHIVPHGTKYNNSTNRKFVLLMDDLIYSQSKEGNPRFMDLGCSGGQLVKDFRDLNWIAVGLEGSDYSLKRKRANWGTLAGKSPSPVTLPNRST